METAVMTPQRTARPASFLEGLGHAVVAGFGRSGRAAARLLARHGVPLTIVDARPEREHAGELATLPGEISFAPEESAAGRLAGSDLVILSPGIDPRREPYASARATGVSFISEIELGWRFVSSPLVAVTGSNGKSTVTSLIGQLLAASGFDARVCGNIGEPLCGALANQTPDTRFAVEVSSFQLERTETFAPDVAVLLNVTPDHMDRYEDLAAYRAAKENLFACQEPRHTAVLCAGDAQALEIARRLARRAGGGLGPRVILAGETIPDLDPPATGRADVEDGEIAVRLDKDVHRFGPVADLPLPGPHNLDNCLAGLAAALSLGADPGAVRPALAAFRPLPHRLEPVGERDGVRLVNDSKATNVESARMALRSFPPGRVWIILGGRDKGGDFASLAVDIKERARMVLAMGEAGPGIAAALKGPLAGSVPVQVLPGLAEAVRSATGGARAGDVILLAPACASFDAYGSFEERGEHFRRLAGDWIEEGRRGA
jgi:UDP-N-acetylmuramoylalanine--D-glutamate ligase